MSDKPNTATIEGTVHAIEELQTFSSGFTKRQLVVKKPGEYVDLIPIDFKKENTALIDGYSVGDSVSAKVFLGGREYNGKYYGDNTGFAITGTPSGASGNTAPLTVDNVSSNAGSDSIPF